MAGSDLDIVLQLLFRDNKSNKSIDIRAPRLLGLLARDAWEGMS